MTQAFAFDTFRRAGFRFVGDRRPDEKWKDAVVAGDAYRKYYRRHKPLFPKAVGTALDQLNKSFVEIANRNQIERVLAENEYTALMETSPKLRGDIGRNLDAIEDAFRRLFAVEL